MLKTRFCLLLSLLFASAGATADLNIRFVESAPKDWFAITNAGECPLTDLVVELDLSTTTGKLIFDTTASGAGVEVFQPFEVREGNIALHSSAAVEDGETLLAVIVSELLPQQTASFTIDVDDTLKDSALGMIRVTGAEIEGGRATVSWADVSPLSGKFDDKGMLDIKVGGC